MKKTPTPKNITKMQSVAFNGYRLQIQTKGHQFRRYCGAASEPGKTLGLRMQAALVTAIRTKDALTEIIASRNAWRDGALTQKAYKALTSIGITIATVKTAKSA